MHTCLLSQEKALEKFYFKWTKTNNFLKWYSIKTYPRRSLFNSHWRHWRRLDLSRALYRYFTSSSHYETLQRIFRNSSLNRKRKWISFSFSGLFIQKKAKYRTIYSVDIFSGGRSLEENSKIPNWVIILWNLSTLS